MSKEQSILQYYQSLCSQRSSWECWWDELRDYVMPCRASRDEEVAQSSSSKRLYDSTAVEACQKLASGHMSYMTPSHEMWFKWASPDPEAGDEAESWYARCSEIANAELARSNFYTVLHECFLDRVGFGTGSLFCGSSRKGHLMFRHVPCGDFVCAEDDEGSITSYAREFTLTPSQAASQFGEKALGAKAKALLRDERSAQSGSLRFIHMVRPRAQRNRRRQTAKDMPFESVYYSLDDDCAVEESGYREFPYMVTRFLKWGDGPYGLAPARLVYPDIRQTQFLNRILDMLGEVAAFPRILELANQAGEVDLRAGGRTLINTESASLGYPREWATQGRYDVGMDRLKQKQDAINRAFFVPMLELWTERKLQMTASEVHARENERVMLFSPSFTLLTQDLQPLMERVFALLFRLGRFPKPPNTVLRYDQRGEASLDEPRVIYQGRIAMVMRRIQAEGTDRAMQRLQQMSTMDPTLVDHVNLDRAFRSSARMDGIAEDILRPEHELRRMRREREEQLAAAANPATSADAQAQLQTLMGS